MKIRHFRSDGFVAQEQLIGPTPHPKSGAVASEEISHVQGKEQQLCFAGVAMKR